MGQEAVNTSCLNQLYELQHRVEDTEEQKAERAFPSLPPLSVEEVREIQNHLSYNKAITEDGFSDIYLRLPKFWKLFSDLWNPQCMELLQSIFNARLVPLNKVWPAIPNYNEFRPIAILSAMYKFLELRFLPKLA